MWKPLRLNWIAFASSLLLFAAILYFLSRKQGLDAFVDVLRRTGAVSFCVAVLLMLVVQGISAYRVKIITAAEALHSTGYRSLVRIQLISQFIAYGAPISALSDLAKAAMIKLRFDLPLGQSIRIVLYERICGALGAIVIGLLTTIWQLATDTPRLLVDIQFAVWAVGLMVGATILVIGELNLTSRNSVLDRIARAVTGLAAILGHRTMGVKLLLISLLQLLGFSRRFFSRTRYAYSSVAPARRAFHAIYFLDFFIADLLPRMGRARGGHHAHHWENRGSVGRPIDCVVGGLRNRGAYRRFRVRWIMRPSMRKSVRLAKSEGRA